MEEMGARQRSSSLRLFEPLGVLVEHGVDDVDEGFVGGEEAVAAGEDVAFEPAFEGVLAEHLHDAAVGGEVAAVGVFGLVCRPSRSCRAAFVDGVELVGGGFVRAEDAEAGHVAAHDVAQEVAEVSVEESSVWPGCSTVTA